MSEETNMQQAGEAALIGLVDGRAVSRATKRARLEKSGYRVVEFERPKAAIDALSDGPEAPRLMIVALDDPGFDACELTRRFRAVSTIGIILEGYVVDEEIIIRAVEAGANEVVALPCPFTRILAWVRLLLSRRAPERACQRATIKVAPPGAQGAEASTHRVEPLDFAGYELLDELGRGGMGIVYRGRRLAEPGGYFAIKLLARHALTNRKNLARFLREIALLRDLESPYVVKVHDSGLERGTHFMVMELLTGNSIKSEIEPQLCLPATQLYRVAHDVGEALAALHRQGLVHRDVKPGNLIRDREGVIKLSDFGLAKRLGESSLTQSGEALGTPYYLAPEAVRGARTDIRGDLYSLGVTLFEAATGRKAFNGETTVEVFESILYDQTPRIDDFRSDLPMAFVALVRRLMCEDRDGRFEDPQALLTALLDVTSPASG